MGEELDDEQIVACPAHPAHKAVVLQPNTGVCFVVILDDVAWCLKTLQETCITHVASERLWPHSLRTEVASLPNVTSSTTRVPYVVLGPCVFIPLAVLTKRLGFRPPVQMTQLVMDQNLSW
jgi:hypothetical protein